MTKKNQDLTASSRSRRCGLMLILTGLMLMTTIVSVSAQSATPPSGNIDTATFDKILEPIWKVYDLVKYVATAIAMLFIVFAGIMFMTSGNDIMQREKAKHTIAYVIVGLVVIWAAPFVVQFIAS